MKGTIKHPLSKASELQQPAVTTGVTLSTYCSLLTQATAKSRGRATAKLKVSLGVFTRWVNQLAPGADQGVNEALMAAFDADMASGTMQRRSGGIYANHDEIVSDIVRLHNVAATKEKSILRKLMVPKNYRRFAKFLTLTDTTQRLLTLFEQRGTRAPGKHNRARRLVTVATRRGCITSALTLLNKLGLRGLEQVGDEHVTGLMSLADPSNSEYRRNARMLHHVLPVCRFGVEEGLLSSNPLTNVDNSNFSSYSVKDFVPPDGITKLRDLSALDMKDDKAVVDRLSALLLYDLGVRLGELAEIELTDLRETQPGRFSVFLRPEVQKMSEKPAVALPVLFPETLRLLELHLTRIRPKYNGVKLLIGRRGEDITREGISNAVKRVGEQLGLQTYYSKRLPGPHCLRRSLGTCNSGGLGLRLSPDELSARLRDGIDVVYQCYVLRNPLISELQGEALRQRLIEGNSLQAAQNSVDVLVKAGAPADLVKRAQEWVRTRKDEEDTSKANHHAAGVPEWIAEAEALTLIEESWSTRFYHRALLDYFRSRNALKRGGRYGKVYLDAREIRTLLSNYQPVRDHLDQPTSRRALAQLLAGCDTLRIGAEVLVATKDLPRFSRMQKSQREKKLASAVARKTSMQNHAEHADKVA